MNNLLKELQCLIEVAEKQHSIRAIARQCDVSHPTIIDIKSGKVSDIKLETYVKIKQGLSGESYAE